MQPESSLPHSHVSATRPDPERTCKIFECIIYVEDLLHVPATFRGQLQGCAVGMICYKDLTTVV